MEQIKQVRHCPYCAMLLKEHSSNMFFKDNRMQCDKCEIYMRVTVDKINKVVQ